VSISATGAVNGSVAAWLAYLLDHPSSERTVFEDVTAHIYLVRATDRSASFIEQASTRFHWEEQVQPQGHGPATVLDFYTGRLS
jgi:hypothetical protein